MKRISQTIHHGIWFVVAIAIGIGGAALLVNMGQLAYSYTEITAQNQHAEKNESPLGTPTIGAESSEKYYVVGTPLKPDLSARSYVVADIETGEILLSHGRKVEYPIASVTKLMTAVVNEQLAPNPETAVVSNHAVATEGFRGGLIPDEEIMTDELTYPLLLVSSNDAAEVIAEHFDRNNFVNQMNTQSKFIGMKNTHFNDPSGLSEHNTATADDVFTLLQYIHSKHPDILDITDQESAQTENHYWENKNRLKQFEPYFAGGKTGYTDAAKRTGAGVFEIPISGNEERSIGIIILGSDSRENDIAKIIRYVQKHIHHGNQESLQSLYQEIEV